MNTYQLEAVMKQDRIARNQFIGVFPMDMLPKKKMEWSKRPFCLIVNSAPSTSEGQHWLAVFVDKDGQGEMFDSYGHDATFYDQRLEVFLKKNCSYHTFNSNELQSLWTSVCGQYCLYFLLHRCRLIPANSIIGLFTRNKEHNDQLVDTFIHKHFPTITQTYIVKNKVNVNNKQKAKTKYECCKSIFC